MTAILQRPAIRRTLLALTLTVLVPGSAIVGLAGLSIANWVVVIVSTSVAGGLLGGLTAVAWSGQQISDRLVLLGFVLGLLCRLAVLPTPNMLSDDVARYHWDGKVTAHGINPYRYAPHEQELDRLPVGRLDHQINHIWLHTVYPPLAQVLFALAWWIDSDGLLGLWLLFLGAEMLCWFLLWRLLDRNRRPRSYLVLLVWSPLAIFEGYCPGHLDIFNLPLLAGLVLALLERRAALSGLLFGLLALVKPVPLIFLPAAARELGLRRTLIMGGVLLLMVGLAYLPLLGAGERLYSSMLRMAREWSFNGSLAVWFESLYPQKFAIAHRYTTLIMAGLVLLGTLVGRDLLSRMLMAAAAWAICTPALFPWYLIPLLALLVLRPDPALLSLAITAPLVELVVIDWQLQGTWKLIPWVGPVEYLLFYSLLLLGGIFAMGMFRRGVPPDYRPILRPVRSDNQAEKT